MKKLKEKIDALVVPRDILAEIISKHCNKDLGIIKNALVEPVIINSKQALDGGLVHEIKPELYEKGVEVISIGDITPGETAGELD